MTFLKGLGLGKVIAKTNLIKGLNFPTKFKPAKIRSACDNFNYFRPQVSCKIVANFKLLLAGV